MRFYIVDVFAETRFSGNQLAVFRDCADLSTAQMQRIAQEMHFSETTFITSERPKKGGYDVRVFTPDAELPFAGHPTLGTAYVVQSKIIGKEVPRVKLNMKVGQVPVAFSYSKGEADLLWMQQRAPTFGKEFDTMEVSELLGIRSTDVDTRFPIMEASTGLSFVIVPLKSLKAVKSIELDRTKSGSFFKKTDSIAFLVFAPETYQKENDLNVRVLIPSSSIPEDPATGSANGCLAAYLVRNRYFGKDEVDLRVEQGYEIDRKSLLLLRAKKTSDRIEVKVGGSVQFVAKGEMQG